MISVGSGSSAVNAVTGVRSRSVNTGSRKRSSPRSTRPDLRHSAQVASYSPKAAPHVPQGSAPSEAVSQKQEMPMRSSGAPHDGHMWSGRACRNTLIEWASMGRRRLQVACLRHRSAQALSLACRRRHRSGTTSSTICICCRSTGRPPRDTHATARDSRSRAHGTVVAPPPKFLAMAVSVMVA